MAQSKEGSKKYRKIGVLLSIGWGALIFWYLTAKGLNPLVLAPNEFGDFLAGILGPIGILWIVLGFWQQGDELRSSVEALNLQSEELRNSVEQQKALVDVTRRQAEAEIAALSEERKARRLASMPKLKVTSGGGSGPRNGRILTSLTLRNIGADCMDVEVDMLGEHAMRIKSIPTLAYGEAKTLNFGHDQRVMECIFEIRFRTRDGELGSVSYRGTREQEKTVGFTLERIDSLV